MTDWTLKIKILDLPEVRQLIADTADEIATLKAKLAASEKQTEAPKGMYIHEAVRQARSEGKAITPIAGPLAHMIFIYPTNSHDCCIVRCVNGQESKTRFAKRWNPSARDLSEPIWAVTD